MQDKCALSQMAGAFVIPRLAGPPQAHIFGPRATPLRVSPAAFLKAVVMVGENAAPLDGWTLPTRYHCGEWCERDCGVCGMDAIRHPQAPPNCELGEN